MTAIRATASAVGLLALTCANLESAAQTVPSPNSGPRPQAAQSATSTTPYNQLQMTGLDAAFAFARMNGTTPDFRPYAEHSSVYTNATTFDRPAALDREIARLEGLFGTFDLDRVYQMRIGVPIQQYDADKGGYPVGFGDTSRIGLTDPVTYHALSLMFRNATDVATIPVPDATAARNLAQRNAFDTHSAQASQGVLQMSYRLVDAPPSLQGQDVLRADVLSARVLSQAGQVVHDFGSLAASAVAVSRNADGTSEQPVLKSADLQGFHVGMTAAEADALGTRGWKAVRGGAGSDEALYFNGLQAASPDYATCADVTFGFPDQQSYFTGAVGAPTYTDCVAVKFAPGSRGSGDAAARRVVGVVTQQRLPGTATESLATAVKVKYGTPLYTRNNGNGVNLAWVGRDPVRWTRSRADRSRRVRPAVCGGPRRAAHHQGERLPRPAAQTGRRTCPCSGAQAVNRAPWVASTSLAVLVAASVPGFALAEPTTMPSCGLSS